MTKLCAWVYCLLRSAEEGRRDYYTVPIDTLRAGEVLERTWHGVDSEGNAYTCSYRMELYVESKHGRQLFEDYLEHQRQEADGEDIPF